MKNQIKATLLTAAVSLIIGANSAFAGIPVVIGGGSESGQFIQIAKDLCKQINTSKLFDCKAKVTKGSLDNHELAKAGTVNLALANLKLAKQWEADGTARIVRTVGFETGFVFGMPDVIKEFADFETVKQNSFLASFAIPSEKSGDYIIFNELVEGTDIESATYNSRSEQIAAIRSGSANLAYAMQVANPKNSFFKDIAKAGMAFMPVVDAEYILDNPDTADLKTVTMKNASFSFSDLTSGKWKSAFKMPDEMTSLAMPIAIIAPVDGTFEGKAAKVQSHVVKKIAEVDEKDLLPADSTMAKVFNSAASTSKEGLTALAETAKATVKKVNLN